MVMTFGHKMAGRRCSQIVMALPVLNGQVGLNHSFSDAWSADFNAQGFNNITESDGDYSDMNRNQAAQLDGGVLFKAIISLVA